MNDDIHITGDVVHGIGSDDMGAMLKQVLGNSQRFHQGAPRFLIYCSYVMANLE